MNLEKLRELNNHIEIREINHPAFRQYGRIIDGYDFTDIIKYMEDNTSVPEDGNIYVVSEKGMETFRVKDRIQEEFYGEMPVEIGYCNRGLCCYPAFRSLQDFK